MTEQQRWDIPAINSRLISIYAMLVEDNGLMLGCGAWDRKRQEHSMEIKNATPGMVLRVNGDGRVVAETLPLGNIVYPLVRLTGDKLFIGCRTGAAYFMDNNLQASFLGSFGEGIYGVADKPDLGRLLLGGRNGVLSVLNSEGLLLSQFSTPANRLWNLCPDKSNKNHVWASSYNGTLYKLDILTGEIVAAREFGPGAVTLISWLSNGTLAVGSLKKKILLLNPDGRLIKPVPAQGGVCFLGDLPESQAFYATDHDGRVWILDYDGRVLDRFDQDTERNNPIWIAEAIAGRKIVFAWANGVIRILKY